ncbi:MAG TPA: hypothetical protein VGS19_13995 [Streptosporangiaceae bacterium]|nr:hypothetical protein [Streptosporangiaceae bacterium]
MGKRERLKRSAGTVMPWDLAKNRLHGPDEKATASDIAAVDSGEGRTVYCSFRGLYGSFPRRFRGYFLDLTADGPVLRPFLGFSFLWRRIPIHAHVVSAKIRPFKDGREALDLMSTGQYAPGGKLEWAGSEIISCRTTEGVLEFAVKRPDVPLVLHYLDRLSQRDNAVDEGRRLH